MPIAFRTTSRRGRNWHEDPSENITITKRHGPSNRWHHPAPRPACRRGQPALLVPSASRRPDLEGTEVLSPTPIPSRVTFRALEDPYVKRIGFEPNSVYIEFCVLPFIGPSCCLLYLQVVPLRRIGGRADLDLGELGSNLDLGAKIGPGPSTPDRTLLLELPGRPRG